MFLSLMRRFPLSIFKTNLTVFRRSQIGVEIPTAHSKSQVETNFDVNNLSKLQRSDNASDKNSFLKMRLKRTDVALRELSNRIKTLGKGPVKDALSAHIVALKAQRESIQNAFDELYRYKETWSK
mmetsp:Transcript_16684/g.23626  ORF Transcript_16684/g.23626 Transcript_16684/m.23626 type:complete len:125 (+) Transcript_16684:77-451(+)